MTENIQEIKYHPGFVGGMELLLWSYRESLDIEEEHYLSREPLRIDLLILKKTEDVDIDYVIAKIFRKYNCIEYKNPKDELSVDEYFKIIALACLYKSMGRTVNEIGADQITASIFRHSYPRDLFRSLRNMGANIEKKYPGVYYITGMICFPTQVIVTKELNRDNYAALRILTPDADEEDVRTFINQATSNEDAGYRRNADAVFQVSVAANKELYERIRRESLMCQALRELMSDEIEGEVTAAVTAAVSAAVTEAVDDRNEEMAEDMLRAQEPLSKIVKYSRLAEDAIREIARKINISVVM